MHLILKHQAAQSIVISDHRDEIEQIFREKNEVRKITELTELQRANYDKWVDYIYTFEYQAMDLTYLMYCSWMFTF